MKIGIDARFLTHPQPGEFKTYSQGLIGALADLDADDEYVLYIDRPPTPDDGLPSRPHFSYRVVPGRLPMIGMPWREQISLSRQAARDGVDILHSLCLTAPLRTACPSVVTIHDTIWLFPARSAGHGKRSASCRLMHWYYRLVPRLAARRAATIITVSYASKEAIIQQLRIPSDRVFVTYEAASPLYRPASERAHVAATLQKYGLVSDFILAIGSADPRKNLARLLEAYALLPVELQARCPLAIVWTHSHLARHISERAAALGIGQRLRFLERVSNQDLAVLYGAASAFVFPSLYEGFGLPLLEAMSCGAPVIAADNSSIPEIAGDAALLVAADDASRMAEAITRVLVDVGLRSSLVERGLRRAGVFSWARCARETVEVYRWVFPHPLTPAPVATREGERLLP